MAKSVNDILKDLPKGRKARVMKQAKVEIEEYSSLQAFRKAIGMTQTDVANTQGVKQVNISNLEKRSDMHLSTLKKYIEALGCKMEIIITKPDNAQVKIDGILGL